MNWKLSGVKPELWRDRRIRGSTANIHWIVEKAREFQKNICFCFINYAKACDSIQLVQLRSIAQLGPTLHDPIEYSTPGFPVFHHFPEFAQIHVHWAGDATQLSHPVSTPYPPAFNLSKHQCLFQRVSSSHRVVKALEASASASVFYNEYSWLTCFRIDWFEIHAVQGTVKSIHQHHCTKASILHAQPSLWSNSH